MPRARAIRGCERVGGGTYKSDMNMFWLSMFWFIGTIHAHQVGTRALAAFLHVIQPYVRGVKGNTSINYKLIKEEKTHKID